MTAARMLEAVAEGGPFTVEVHGDRYYLVAGTGRMFGPVGSADRAGELVAVLRMAETALDAAEVTP